VIHCLVKRITWKWLLDCYQVIRKVTNVCYLKLVAQIPKWHPTCWLTTLLWPPPPHPAPPPAFPTHPEPSFPTNTEFHFWGNGPWPRHQRRRSTDWRDVYLCPRTQCPGIPACRVTNGVRSDLQRQGTARWGAVGSPPQLSVIFISLVLVSYAWRLLRLYFLYLIFFFLSSFLLDNLPNNGPIQKVQSGSSSNSNHTPGFI
jgi:hypothetical protein